ncbi:MAG: FtsX-like permease family protein [Acidimicrobiales bacterium]|nr:FtsX-like permease family protein [Acidimicrobiales bacterium]
MLLVLLEGLSTGIDRRVTVYEDRSGAELFVAQPGTRSFLGSTSAIPSQVVDQVRALPSVTWVSRVRGFFSVQLIEGRRVPAYVVGYDAGSPGGPWSLVQGREPAADDEVVVASGLANRAGLAVGQTIALFGRPFTVVGVAGDADMFMASFVFMTHAATDALLGSSGTTSFVLVGTDEPETAIRNIRGLGLHALTTSEIRTNDLALKGQAYTAGLRLILAVAFSVGTLVIALTIYSTVMDRRREYGVVKALGASGMQLGRLVLAQTLALALAGLLVGLVLAATGAAVIGWVRPQFAIVVTPQAVKQVVAMALAMGVVAAVVPLRRLVDLPPAVAFAGG